MFDKIPSYVIDEINEVLNKHSLPLMRAEHHNLNRIAKEADLIEAEITYKFGRPIQIKTVKKTINLDRL